MELETTSNKYQLSRPLPTEIFTPVKNTPDPAAAGRLFPPAPAPEPMPSYNGKQMSSKSDYTVDKWDKYLPFYLVLVPLIVFIILLLLSPLYIKSTELDENPPTLNFLYIALWTLVISIIVFVVMYGLNYCRCRD